MNYILGCIVCYLLGAVPFSVLFSRGMLHLSLIHICTPVYLLDPVHHAIGLCHAGWRSTVGGMVTNLIDAMTAMYQTCLLYTSRCV